MLRRREVMRVLVTDGNERVALAAARSLVRAGHDVCVTASTRGSLAGVSSGVRPAVLHADPFENPAGYAAELARIARREDADILLPMTDASVEAVLEHRRALPAEIVVPGPNLETYRAASNKAQMLELACACGFGGPETRVLDTPGGGALERQDLAAMFPAVVKPHRSVVTVQGVRRKLAVVPVSDVAACERVLAALPPAAFPVLLQRRVSGVGEGFFALRWDGRIVAMFAHRRLREKPPTGGVSVYRESIPLSEDLVGPGVRLLDALDWQGVAMIECKRDAETGRQIVMEVNGRFWGSLQLAVDAGVDFPALLVQCAAGGAGGGARVPESRDYRIGVRSRWFWGDVDHLFLRLRDGGGSRLGAVGDFLRACLRRDRSEVWRWSDPMPFAVETLQWLGNVTRGTNGATRRSRATPKESVPDSGVP